MRFRLLFLLCIGSFHALFSQILEPVKWSFSANKISGTEYDLLFTANIQDNWYVYSQYLEGDDGPVPTTFTYEKSGAYQLVGKSKEISDHRKEGFDPIFKMKVIKFSHKLVISQRVKVSDPSKPIKGYLNFMTCDNTTCLPPTDVNFAIVPGGKQADKSAPAKVGDATGGSPAASPDAKKSGILDPVSWAYEVKKISDKEFDLIFKAKIEKNWHIYSQYLSNDDGPVKTSFNLNADANVKLLGKNKEDTRNRKEAYDKNFDMQLVFFENEATFTQRVQVRDATKPVKGYLEFMVCDDSRCLPPKQVDFEFNLAKGSGIAPVAVAPVIDTASQVAPGAATASADDPTSYAFDHGNDKTTCETVAAPDEESAGLFWIFLLGFGGGLIALLTPCVFPMVPITVGFFTKSSTNKAKGLRNAIIYALSIIVIYVSIGILVTAVFGADALNLLSTNAWFNIFFCLLFVAFAISFFGYYEITLPSAWVNKSDQAADRGGLIGIFFMAFTLSLVSFSCTGPIIGTLLVETATGGSGNAPTLLGHIPLRPIVGMFGFSMALGLPFGLFAAFPAWLHALPKSGGWMETVKVTLGFVELALAMKFLSVADLTMGWNIMPYELFLAIWVLCALGLAMYYFKFIKFPHDDPRAKRKLSNYVLGAIAVGLAIYFGAGFRYSPISETFITPNLLSGIAPPPGHSYIYPKDCPQNLECFHDFEAGLAFAKKVQKPILLDFTGYGCVNCRRMEDNVWSQPGVIELIRDKYVLISLYVDDRKALDKPYISKYDNGVKRTVGNKWAEFEARHFNRNSQPYYVLLNDELKVLNAPKAYTPDIKEYQAFLQCGVDRYGELKK